MDTGLTLSIVVAVSENGVIGSAGGIPWKLSDDLRHFAALTRGRTVIVGRTTQDDIIRRLGHPLTDRRTIVLTRQQLLYAGCDVAHSWEEALALAQNDGEVFVIGGEQVYRLALPVANRIYLTRVHASFGGDAFFPVLNPEEWNDQIVDRHDADVRNDCPFSFVYLRRRASAGAPGPIQSYVVLANARHEEQARVMEDLERRGVCPFCEEERATSADLLPVVKEGQCWEVRPNRWPYASTALHLLVVLKRHATQLAELTPEERLELMDLLSWVEQAYGIVGGAVAMRFGDPTTNGATVDHLHAHFIVADQDTTVPEYAAVRFRMGPKAPSETKKSPLS